jgi:hypothetical protein
MVKQLKNCEYGVDNGRECVDLRRAFGQIRLKDDWNTHHLLHVLDVVPILLAESEPAKVFLLVCQLGFRSLAGALDELGVRVDAMRCLAA